jgi:hypothetical protein
VVSGASWFRGLRGVAAHRMTLVGLVAATRAQTALTDPTIGMPCASLRSRGSRAGRRAGVRRQTRRCRARDRPAGVTVGQSQPSERLVGVEGPGGSLYAARREELPGIPRASARQGEQQGRGAKSPAREWTTTRSPSSAKPGFEHASSRQSCSHGSGPPPTRVASRSRRTTPSAIGASCQSGEHIDRGSGPGQDLVGQGAQLEALGHDVGRGQQLVGAQPSRAAREPPRARRSAARGTYRASRRSASAPSAPEVQEAVRRDRCTPSTHTSAPTACARSAIAATGGRSSR